jgi:hypothetical protein
VAEIGIEMGDRLMVADDGEKKTARQRGRPVGEEIRLMVGGRR